MVKKGTSVIILVPTVLIGLLTLKLNSYFVSISTIDETNFEVSTIET